ASAAAIAELSWSQRVSIPNVANRGFADDLVPDSPVRLPAQVRVEPAGAVVRLQHPQRGTGEARRVEAAHRRGHQTVSHTLFPDGGQDVEGDNLRARTEGRVGQAVAAARPVDPACRKILRKLWQAASRRHSPRAPSSPRRSSWRPLWQVMIWPKTGSTMALRRL